MIRGKTFFRCPCCGHIFKALDIEDGATVFSIPMPCPKCGTDCYTLGPLGWIQALRDKARKK